jgi:hypothetical protein
MQNHLVQRRMVMDKRPENGPMVNGEQLISIDHGDAVPDKSPINHDRWVMILDIHKSFLVCLLT